MLRQRYSHQQSAVTAASNSQMLRAGDTLFDKLLGDCREIIVDALAIFLETCSMPLRSELAAATNVGERVDSAAVEPYRSVRRRVVRSVRHLEATVRIEQRWIGPVAFHVLTVDNEEGNLRSVFRSCLELLNYQPRCVEHRRKLLHLGNFSVFTRRVERGRLNEVGESEEVAIRLRRCRDYIDGAEVRRRDLDEGPRVPGVTIATELTPNVVENVDQQIVACRRDAIDRFARPGLHHQLEVALSRHEILERRGNQRSSRPRLTADCPRISDVDDQLIADQIEISVVWFVDLYELPFVIEILRVLVEVYAVAQTHIAAIAGIATEGKQADMIRRDFQDGRR